MQLLQNDFSFIHDETKLQIMTHTTILRDDQWIIHCILDLKQLSILSQLIFELQPIKAHYSLWWQY
jgi:hypothetical protein